MLSPGPTVTSVANAPTATALTAATSLEAPRALGDIPTETAPVRIASGRYDVKCIFIRTSIAFPEMTITTLSEEVVSVTQMELPDCTVDDMIRTVVPITNATMNAHLQVRGIHRWIPASSNFLYSVVAVGHNAGSSSGGGPVSGEADEGGRIEIVYTHDERLHAYLFPTPDRFVGGAPIDHTIACMIAFVKTGHRVYELPDDYLGMNVIQRDNTLTLHRVGADESR